MTISAADFMQVQLAGAQKKFGMNCYKANEHYIRQFGIPLPSLALQYMFGVENLPFGRMYGFRGATESFKSSMVFYLLRNIMAQEGLGILVETERKVSDTLMEGIIQEYMDLLQQYNADTLEMAQGQLTFAMEFIKKNLVDRNIPYGLGWDSLRGVLSEATSNKISADGHYSKSYSAEAHALSPFFAKMVEELSFWPMMLFFVQHEKKKQAEGYGGGGGTASLGGDAPGFHATVLTRSRVIKSVTEGSLNPYATIEYRTVKNNLGVKGRRCEVNLYFNQEYDEETGMNEHKYWFDWDRADIDCILSDKMENKAAIKKVIALEEHSSNKGFFRCPELGLKKATAKEVMDLLRSEEHQDLFDQLRRTMRITKNLRFDQVEWTKVAGTDKKPINGWAVKEGVDLRGIHKEPLSAEEEEEDAGKESK